MLNKKTESKKNYIFGYHTQEFRAIKLTEPIICDHNKAWLGTGYYFCLEENFAHYWGKDAKKDTGYYDIYTSWIEYDKIINATFDDEGYFFWKDRIEKTITHLKSKGFDITLAKVHEFLANNVWDKFDVKGIIFDDIPQNPKKNRNRIYSEILPLYYEKRLQLVIFDEQMSHDFTTLHRKKSCNDID